MKKKVTLTLIIMIVLILVCLLFFLIKQSGNSDTQDKTDTESTLIESTYIVNDFEYASVKIDADTVTPNSVTVSFEYTGKYTAITGEWFTLEKKIDGKWYQIPRETIDGATIAFNLVAYPLEHTQPFTKEYKWKIGYPSLSSGTYRIIVAIDEFFEQKYNTHYFAAEFIIK